MANADPRGIRGVMENEEEDEDDEVEDRRRKRRKAGGAEDEFRQLQTEEGSNEASDGFEEI